MATAQARWDPSRKKIGDYQLEWIFEKFSASKSAGKTYGLLTGSGLTPQYFHAAKAHVSIYQ
eukprot:6211414-Pleurochrysis_carterae.AAC.2